MYMPRVHSYDCIYSTRFLSQYLLNSLRLCPNPETLLQNFLCQKIFNETKSFSSDPAVTKWKCHESAGNDIYNVNFLIIQYAKKKIHYSYKDKRDNVQFSMFWWSQSLSTLLVLFTSPPHKYMFQNLRFCTPD